MDSAGPRLPVGCAPRRVLLPFAERFDHGANSFSFQDDRSETESSYEDNESEVDSSLPDYPLATTFQMDSDEGESRQVMASAPLPVLDEREQEPAWPGPGPVMAEKAEVVKVQAAEVEATDQVEEPRHCRPSSKHTSFLSSDSGVDGDFQALLLEISVEHHRALAAMQARFESRIKEARLEALEIALKPSTPSPACCTPRTPQPGDSEPLTPLRAESADILAQRVDSPTQSQPLRGATASKHRSSLKSVTLRGKKKPHRARFDTFEMDNEELERKLRSNRLSPFDWLEEDKKLAVPQTDDEDASATRWRLLHLLGWQGKRLEDVERGAASTDTGESSKPSLCMRIVGHQAFDASSGVLIFVNSLMQGWAANYAVTCAINGESVHEMPRIFQLLTIAFTVVFLVELLMRLWAKNCQRCCSDEWAWTMFDAAVVFSDVVNCVVEFFYGSSVGSENLSMVRMLRVLRITRALRLVRLFRFFRELRMMLYSVMRSGSSLLWSCVLLSFTIYTFAVYFMQILAQTMADHHESVGSKVLADEEYRLLTDLFGDLGRAEYSLYMAISGGISWGEISGLFLKIHSVHGVVFCIFVFFTSFAVLNIITGIFVESAMSSARSNQEEVVQEQLHNTAGLLEEMKKIFNNADCNSDGCISFEEFEAYLDRKEVRAYLDALGIGMEKAKGLFELLDLDASGEITVEEFAFGCLRLKGSAKSIDLATLMNHSRRIAQQLQRYFTWSEGQFKRLHEFQVKVEDRLSLPASTMDRGRTGSFQSEATTFTANLAAPHWTSS